MQKLSEKYKPLLKCLKCFIPPQTDGMICFYSNIGCSGSKAIFKWWKKNNNKNQKKSLYKEQTIAPRVFHSVSVRTLTERHKQTQAMDAQKLAQNVFPPWKTERLKDQHWRRAVSSLSRGHFRNVFVKSLEMLGFWSFIFL